MTDNIAYPEDALVLLPCPEAILKSSEWRKCYTEKRFGRGDFFKYIIGDTPTWDIYFRWISNHSEMILKENNIGTKFNSEFISIKGALYNQCLRLTRKTEMIPTKPFIWIIMPSGKYRVYVHDKRIAPVQATSLPMINHRIGEVELSPEAWYTHASFPIKKEIIHHIPNDECTTSNNYDFYKTWISFTQEMFACKLPEINGNSTASICKTYEDYKNTTAMLNRDESSALNLAGHSKNQIYQNLNFKIFIL